MSGMSLHPAAFGNDRLWTFIVATLAATMWRTGETNLDRTGIWKAVFITLLGSCNPTLLLGYKGTCGI
jgi:hypothetical protein